MDVHIAMLTDFVAGAFNRMQEACIISCSACQHEESRLYIAIC